MSHLEIQNLAGDTRIVELSKDQPVSIGSSDTNDITINDDADIASMHCRISWKKKCFVITSASSEGADLNGTLVLQAPYYSGDILRVGSLDIILNSEESKRPTNGSSDDDDYLNTELAPITEDEFDIQIKNKSALGKMKSKQQKDNIKEKTKDTHKNVNSSKKKKEMAEESLLPDDFFDDDDLMEAELIDDDDDDDEIGGSYSLSGEQVQQTEPPEEDVAGKPVLKRRTSEEASDELEDESEPQPQESILKKLKPRHVRPGEQDVIRSPFVLSLTSGSFILFLLAAIFWLIIGRETSQKQFDNAKAAYDAGQYNQAITQLQNFLKEYPQHRFSVPARFALGHAAILKEISGSSPNWDAGLQAIDKFNREYRDLPDFKEERDKLREYAQTIALGAAKSAAVQKDEQYLKISSDAASMMDRLAPGDPALDEVHQEILEAHKFAKAEIRKAGVYDSYIAKIENIIEHNQPVQALIEREALLVEYPEFEQDKKVRDLFRQALDLEKSLVTRAELVRDAVTGQPDVSALKSLSLTRNTRARSFEESQDRIIAAVAKDCCYGVDTVTGQTMWRRVIGLDTPFFPISVNTSVDALLAFDTNHRDLILIARQNGSLVWRQNIEGQVTGPPLIHESQIYLPTLNKQLFKLNLETGRITAILNFTQNVIAPPAITKAGTHLVVAGETGVLYTMTLRPLECETVTYLGHDTGAIEAPLMTLGSNLLVMQNDQLESALLQVLDTREITRQLNVVDERRIAGQVRDQPVLRGNELFIPARREQIYSYTVSDTPGVSSLNNQQQFKFQNPQPGPIYLSAGPDSQVWMASSALRKLELKSDAFKRVPGEIAEGRSTQPLQNIGKHLFFGRRSAYSNAIFFSRADRETMTSEWRTVLGSSVKVVLNTNGASTLFVTESGDVYRLIEKDLDAGRFQLSTSYSPVIPNTVQDAVLIHKVDENTISIAVGGEEPELLLVNQAGQLSSRLKLDEPLIANPVVLKAGVVLPYAGRLKLMNRSGFAIKVQDMLADEGDQQVRWKQLEKMDDQQCLVLNNQSRLSRVQYRSQPAAHLAEVVKRTFDSAVDFNFVLANNKVYLADIEGDVYQLDAANLDTLQKLSLKAPVTNHVWLQKNYLLVETGNNKLHCFNVSPRLKSLWSTDVTHLAGMPLLVEEELHLTMQNGEYYVLNAETGKQLSQTQLNQTLNHGPALLGKTVVLISIDGTIYPAEQLMSEKSKTNYNNDKQQINRK